MKLHNHMADASPFSGSNYGVANCCLYHRNKLLSDCSRYFGEWPPSSNQNSAKHEKFLQPLKAFLIGLKHLMPTKICK